MRPHHHPVSCLLILAVGLLIHPATARAQAPAPTASVSGRVSQAATGQYLNNARISVQGTNLVAFTDESGTYRLDRVAAGTVVLEVFYTGLEPQTVSLALAPVTGHAVGVTRCLRFSPTRPEPSRLRPTSWRASSPP